MSQGSQGSLSLATEDDVVKWLDASGRKWRQKVHGLNMKARVRYECVSLSVWGYE